MCYLVQIGEECQVVRKHVAARRTRGSKAQPAPHTCCTKLVPTWQLRNVHRCRCRRQQLQRITLCSTARAAAAAALLSGAPTLITGAGAAAFMSRCWACCLATTAAQAAASSSHPGLQAYVAACCCIGRVWHPCRQIIEYNAPHNTPHSKMIQCQ